MPKILTKAAIALYERDGFYHPVCALDADEVASCRRDVEKVERERLDDIGGAFRHKPLRTSSAQTSLSGLRCFFTKDIGDTRYVGWHQDSTIGA